MPNSEESFHSMPPPWYYGIKDKGLAYQDNKITKYKFEFGAAKSLKEFEFFQFFSPGILYEFGFMSDVILADFYVTSGYSPIFVAEFSDAVFKYPTGRGHWDNVLWAMAKSSFSQLSDTLCSTLLRHPRVGMIGYAEQVLKVKDPLEIQTRTANRETAADVEIASFGVRAQSRVAYVDPETAVPAVKIKQYTNVDLHLFLAAMDNGANPWDLVEYYETQERKRLATGDVKATS